MTTTAQNRRSTFGEAFAEIVPLIGFVPGYGPPAISVLGPWLFLGLVLAGPLAWLFVLVVVLIVGAALLAALTAAIGAILAAPYLLVRRLRRHRASQTSISAPIAPVAAIGSPRVAA